ncbi:MAG: hypothetical protein JWL90_4004, partial [Chthoniobacteraceae bacterium]|nr:hypothetical protein [Chthoniobacteraceae bacterium]
MLIAGTTEERSRQRIRLLMRSAGVSAFGRVITVFCLLAQVPIALRFLGQESFGLWITLTGAASLLNFADLGMGLGMQNKISEAHGKDDMARARDIFLTGFAALGAIAGLLFLIGLLLGWHVNWAALFKIVNPDVQLHVNECAFVVFLAFCLGFPLSSAQKLAVAFQLGWLQAVAGTIGSLISLGLIWAAAAFKLSLLSFVAVAVIPPTLVNFGLLVYLLRLFHWRFDPIRHARWEHARDIFGEGFLFALPQIGAMLLSTAPAVLLSTIVGAAVVTPFNLAQRLIGIITQAQGMLIAPLWPAYAEANSRGDHAWIQKTFPKSLVFSLGITLVPCVFFAFTGRWIIFLWTQNSTTLPSQKLVWLMSGWAFFVSMGVPPAALLNGLGHLRGQATYGMFSAVLGLLLMPWLIHRFGACGIPIALLVSYAPIAFPLV